MIAGNKYGSLLFEPSVEGWGKEDAGAFDCRSFFTAPIRFGLPGVGAQDQTYAPPDVRLDEAPCEGFS